MPPAPCTTGSTITAASSPACCRDQPASARPRTRSSTPASNPAGGSPANTCRGSTPSHIRCMPPSGSHTDIAMNVSPWYPPRQVSSRLLARQAARPPVLQAHLDRDLDADRARVAQEHVLEPVRRERREPVGQSSRRARASARRTSRGSSAPAAPAPRRRARGARTRGSPPTTTTSRRSSSVPSASRSRTPLAEATTSGGYGARHRGVRMPDPLPVQLKQLLRGEHERDYPERTRLALGRLCPPGGGPG